MSSPSPEVIDPCDALDHERVVARGGDYYGWHWLFKCPKCGHPVIHDFEHDYFYPDVSSMQPRLSLASSGDTCPCPSCGRPFAADEIWAFSNAHRSYPDWLLTPADVENHALQGILKKPKDNQS